MSGFRSRRSSGSETRDMSWDASLSSASSGGSGYSSSSGSGRNRVRAAVRAIGVCFGSPKAAEDSSPSTPLGTIHSAERRKSGKGLYIGRLNPSEKESRDKKFTISDIRKATKNFSPALEIGKGSFGVVYKAKLDDRMLVAVKRAKKASDDSQLGTEFQTEIETMACIEHLNLVRLYGYLEHEQERILVIEYVPNGTLREHLERLHGSTLEFAARLDIAIDIAHAVTYLHMYTDHPIIHRDIKSANILLTENLRAKVADFGFARHGTADTDATHISTQVKGTAGYLDPEYLQTYQLTVKSDVYSFGVLLIEIISGRRPIELERESKERVTVKWAMKKFMDGNAIHTLDPNLSPTLAITLAVEMILELASRCLAPTRQNRPSMRRCAEILWGIRKDYRELISSDLSLPSEEEPFSKISIE